MTEQLLACAQQLESALPSEQDAATFAVGGVVSTVSKLISAIRGGDYKTAFSAAVDLLVMARDALIGDGEINFGAAALPGGMDWGTLLTIITTIIGLLGKK